MGSLIEVFIFRESSFGIIDKYSHNTDIRLKYFRGVRTDKNYSSIIVFVNGKEEEEIPVESQEALAAKPIKCVTKKGRHLSIGFDKLAGHLFMMHQGVNAENLPVVIPRLQIFQNQISDTDTSDQR